MAPFCLGALQAIQKLRNISSTLYPAYELSSESGTGCEGAEQKKSRFVSIFNGDNGCHVPGSYLQSLIRRMHTYYIDVGAAAAAAATSFSFSTYLRVRIY